MPERSVMLQHAVTKVQGVVLAQSTADAVNDDIEIVIELPIEGVSQASVLGLR
jgi:hypothetical protein